MKTETVSRYLAGLALLAFTGVSAAAEQQAFVMSVPEGATSGQMVLQGEDKATISKIRDAKEIDALAFAEAMSLCVALTRTRQLDEAEQACDRAINRSRSRADAARAARRGARGGVAYMAYPSRINYAAAMSNRGVLYALSGDESSALASFETALDADPYLKAAKSNIARISSN